MEKRCYPSHFHIVKGPNGEYGRVTHDDLFVRKVPITIFDRLKHPSKVGAVELAKRVSGVLI